MSSKLNDTNSSKIQDSGESSKSTHRSPHKNEVIFTSRSYSDLHKQMQSAISKESEAQGSQSQISEDETAPSDDCPVHTALLLKTENEPSWRNRTHKVLKLLGAVSFIACPPIPQLMFRKILFSPPPKLLHYYFDGERVAHFSAGTAHTANRPLTICLPYMASPHMQCLDVLLQLRRIEVDTVVTSKGHFLAVIRVRCEKFERRMKSLGVKRSPHLVIFSQPNSSDIGMCMFTDPNLADIADFLQCDVLAFDYSGYGISTGRPNEKNIYADVDAVWNYATKTLGYDEADIILFGFSIGTAAMAYLAAKHPKIRALILFAPFTSFLRVLARNPHKEDSCRTDKFCTVDRAKNITCRTIICHGRRDWVVKPEHSLALKEHIANAMEPVLVDCTHQSIFCDRSAWEKVRKFVLENCHVTTEWLKEMNKAIDEKTKSGSRTSMSPWAPSTPTKNVSQESTHSIATNSKSVTVL
ncbi:unnamed protein product, partial [Mesorhabditis spiculigera]